MHAGQEFDDCSGADWCPRMVVIPTGAFTMGAPANEPGRYEEEGPEHRVQIAEFAAGKYVVTRGKWAAFVAATAVIHTAAAPGPAGPDRTGPGRLLARPQLRAGR